MAHTMYYIEEELKSYDFSKREEWDRAFKTFLHDEYGQEVYAQLLSARYSKSEYILSIPYDFWVNYDDVLDDYMRHLPVGSHRGWTHYYYTDSDNDIL